MVRRLALVALSIALATEARADSARQVVERFVRVYASGDEARARSLWAPQQEPRFTRLIARSMRSRCLLLHRVTVRELQRSSSAAEYEIDAEVTSSSAMPADRGRIERMVVHVQLERSSGGWKLVNWQEPEREVADAIVAAPDAWFEQVEEALGRGLRLRLIVRHLTRVAMGRVHRGDPAAGALLIRLASTVAETYGDTDAMAEAVGAESILASEDDRDEARRLAEMSLSHARMQSNPDVVARALLRLGRVDGKYEDTPHDPHAQVLALADVLESEVTVATAALRMANHFLDTGKLREALHYGVRSLRHAEHANEPPSVLSASLALGAIYARHGDGEMAARYYRDAVLLTRQTGLSAALPAGLAGLADAYAALGQHDDALAALEEAIPLVPTDELAQQLLIRSRLYLARGEAHCARADAEAALRAAPLAQSEAAEAWAVLAACALRDGSPAEALENAGLAIDLAADSALLAGRMEEARALRDLGRFGEAEAAFRGLVARIEEQRESSVVEARQLQMFMKTMAAAYAELADLQISLGRDTQAARTIRTMRASALRALQQDGGGRQNFDGDSRHERLQAQLATLNRQRLAASGVPQEELRQQLTAVRLELDALHAARAAGGRGPRAPAAPASDPVLRPGLIAVEYFVAREQVYALVRQRGGEDEPQTLRVVRLPAALKPLQERIDAFAQAIRSRDLAFRRHSRWLYDQLVAPLALDGRATAVCIIPDAGLWTVPFQALISGSGEYWGQQATIFYAPSIDHVAGAYRGRPRDRGDALQLLAFANPQLGAGEARELRARFRSVELGALPDAEEEARALASMYGPRASRVYVGREAREATFKERTEGARYIHIATHGIVDSAAPLYSSLVLAASDAENDDGLLQAREIASLSLGCEMAVLSACDTGAGAVLPGEGVVGLGWAFLAAGCRTAVVSQWRADSAATKQLMIEFHRRLRRGHSAPEALRAAQAALRSIPEYSHPMYWASFIVLGAADAPAK